MQSKGLARGERDERCKGRGNGTEKFQHKTACDVAVCCNQIQSTREPENHGRVRRAVGQLPGVSVFDMTEARERERTVLQGRSSVRASGTGHRELSHRWSWRWRAQLNGGHCTID